MNTIVPHSNNNIEPAYQSALNFVKNHYENFPVVSFLIPKDLRKHIAIIYWFARTADDFADEGSFTEEERINKLNFFEDRLTELVNGNAENDFELALSETIKQRNLNTDLFYDLLTAFKQDVVKNRYDNFDEILNYCKHSANPVGRLILELFNIRNEEAARYSDKICTALQLTNFYQDTVIDFNKGRIYYPLNEMEKFSVYQKTFELKENNSNLRLLVKLNVDRAAAMFEEGKNLLKYLDGRLKLEIKWTIYGGEEILAKIRRNDYNVFKRPELTKLDFPVLLIKSFL
ncbi:MAG: squalene synthase HpnC [Ignavibacteriaceae bacterium]